MIVGPRQFQVLCLDPPSPDSDQVRVRLEGCGVCGSNLPPWQGRPWFDYPLPPGSPGHEGWGVIDAVGENVSLYQPGDRVAVISTHAFAEYDIASSGEVVFLPPELENRPFPAEPLACACNIFRRSAVEQGQTVAVIGVGFMGALVGALATDAGARVIAVSRRDCALDIAASFGACHCIKFQDTGKVVARILELTGGQGCERVIEAVGHQISLDIASEVVRTGGKLIIAGYHQDGVRTVDLQSWNWKGIDVINAHERDPLIIHQGLQEAIELVVKGTLNPFPLFTHSFSIEQMAGAFEMLSARPPGFMKALISYE